MVVLQFLEAFLIVSLCAAASIDFSFRILSGLFSLLFCWQIYESCYMTPYG